ncbi:hypothetical protein Tco_0445723 [Tanacetum coccineum]
MTPEDQEAIDIMRALKESKKTSRRQPCTRGSSEGTGRIPRVPDESTAISATSSEGTKSEYSEEYQGDDEEVDWIDSDEDEEKKHVTDDDKSIDLKMTDDEFVQVAACNRPFEAPSSVFTVPPVPPQTTAPIPTPPITTDAPTITTVVPKSDTLSAVQLRVAKLEKDVSELKKIDH